MFDTANMLNTNLVASSVAALSRTAHTRQSHLMDDVRSHIPLANIAPSSTNLDILGTLSASFSSTTAPFQSNATNDIETAAAVSSQIERTHFASLETETIVESSMERKRRMNIIHSRRKRERRKAETEELEHRYTSLCHEHDELLKEESRLMDLLQQAQTYCTEENERSN
jgi:hypothetical protein